MNRVEPFAFLLSLALMGCGAWELWGLGAASLVVGVAVFVDLSFPDKPAPSKRPRASALERPRTLGGDEP